MGDSGKALDLSQALAAYLEQHRFEELSDISPVAHVQQPFPAFRTSRLSRGKFPEFEVLECGSTEFPTLCSSKNGKQHY